MGREFDGSESSTEACTRGEEEGFDAEGLMRKV